MSIDTTAKALKGESPTFTATQARDQFSDILDLAVHDGPVFISRRKQRIALISADLLQKLLEAAEAEAASDLEAAKSAYKEYQEHGGVTLDELRAELGID